MLSREHGQLHGDTCKRDRSVMKEKLEDETVVDENQLEGLRSESSRKRRKERTNKEMLSSGHEQLQKEASKRGKCVVTEKLDDEVAVDEGQHQSLISGSSVRTKKQRTDKERRSREHGSLQRETTREGTVVTMENVVDESQVYLASNRKETFPSQHHQPQPETNEQMGAMAVNEGMVVNSEIELVSSSSPVHHHDVSETKESLSGTRQELQKEACDRLSALTETGPGEMAVDHNGDWDLSLSSRKSSQVNLRSEKKGALRNDQQLTVANSQVAGCCSHIWLQAEVNGIAADSERTLSSNRSGKCQSKSENKDTLAGQRQPLHVETVNQIFAEAENCDARTVSETETSNQMAAMIERNARMAVDESLDAQSSQQTREETNCQMAVMIESDTRMSVDESLDVQPSQQLHVESSSQMALGIQSDSGMAVDESLDARQSQQTQEEISNQMAVRIVSDERMSMDESLDVQPSQQPQAETSSQMAVMIDTGDARMTVDESLDVQPSQQPQAETISQMAVMIDTGDARMTVDESLDVQPSQQPQAETISQMAVMIDTGDARMTVDESLDADSSQRSQAESSNLLNVITDNSDTGMAVDESQDADPSQQPQAETSYQMAVITDNGDTGITVDESQDADPSQQPQAETSYQMAVITDNGDTGITVDESQDADPSQQPQAETSYQMAVITDNGDTGMAVDESQDADPRETSYQMAVITDNGDTGITVDESQDADPSQQPQAETSFQMAVITDNGDTGMAVDESQDADPSQQPQAETSYQMQRLDADPCQQVHVEGSNEITAMTENCDEGMARDHSHDSGEHLPSRKSSHVHLKIGSTESWSSEHNIVVETIGQAAAMTEIVENIVVEVQSQGQTLVHLKSLQDKREEPQTAFPVNTDSVLGEMPLGGVQQPDETPSLSKSREIDPGYKNEEIFPSEGQQSEAPTAAFTETVGHRMKEVESQDADRTLLSDNSVEIHLRNEDKETSLSEQQQAQAPENSNQISAVEESQDPNQTLANSDNQLKPQVEMNKERGYAMAEKEDEGMIVDQLPCSSKLMQKGSEVMRHADVQRTAASVGIGDTELIGGKSTRSRGQDSGAKWKTIKFYTRTLKGHTDLVRSVDCRDSVLLSGG